MLDMWKSATIPISITQAELNGQSLEIGERFCYLFNIIVARGVAVNSFKTRIRSGWSRFRRFGVIISH